VVEYLTSALTALMLSFFLLLFPIEKAALALKRLQDPNP
jgi:hypothetical protein